MSNNLATVQKMYACFAQGDVPGILACFSPNVVLHGGGDPALVPFAGIFNGTDGAIRFFTNIGTTVQTTNFVASNYQDQGGKIINDVLHEGMVTATGKKFSAHLVFTWEFNDAGLASNWIGGGDYSSVNEAFKQ